MIAGRVPIVLVPATHARIGQSRPGLGDPKRHPWCDVPASTRGIRHGCILWWPDPIDRASRDQAAAAIVLKLGQCGVTCRASARTACIGIAWTGEVDSRLRGDLSSSLLVFGVGL